MAGKPRLGRLRRLVKVATRQLPEVEAQYDFDLFTASRIDPRAAQDRGEQTRCALSKPAQDVAGRKTGRALIKRPWPRARPSLTAPDKSAASPAYLSR